MFLGRWREEAGYAILGESRCLPVEGARRGTGLLGTFRRRMAKEDNGTNQLIGELFGELGEQVELLPIIRWFEARTGASRHGHPPTVTRADSAQ